MFLLSSFLLSSSYMASSMLYEPLTAVYAQNISILYGAVQYPNVLS